MCTKCTTRSFHYPITSFYWVKRIFILKLRTYSWLNNNIAWKNHTWKHENRKNHLGAFMLPLVCHLAALLVALLFIAQATAEVLTIVTTDVEDDTENRRQDDQDCRQQLQEQQYLNDCQRYLRQQIQQSERFDTTSEREQRQQCCRQLKQLSRNCRCDGLNEMLRQLKGQLQGQDLREMMQIAQNLPKECNIKPRSCEIEMRSSRI